LLHLVGINSFEVKRVWVISHITFIVSLSWCRHVYISYPNFSAVWTLFYIILNTFPACCLTKVSVNYFTLFCHTFCCQIRVRSYWN